METGPVKKTSGQVQRQNPLAGHAMEFVADIDGVVYINDSISISVEGTWNSLNSCNENIILILGGIDSRNDYSMLEELVNKKVKMIIGLGTDNSRIIKALAKAGREIKSATSVQEAVELAAKEAGRGYTVLFSPSCPSYHPFDNYKNRGNDFKRAVNSLTQKK